MIRVLRIINRFNIGGPTYNVTYLSAYLGDEYETLLVGGEPEIGEADSLYITEKHGLKPMIIPELKRQPDLSSDMAAYRKIKSIIKEFSPHIVHTHASKAGAIGRRAAKSCNVPIIIHTFHGHVFHSYFGKIKTSIFKKIERKLARKSTKIIAISNLQKKELSEDFKICKPEKIEVIPLGFELERFYNKREVNRTLIRKKYNLEQETVAIAIVGRLATVKNHDFFLKSIVNLLSKTETKVKVFIVGNGDLWDEIIEKVKIINSNFDNEIVMTSWIKEIDQFNCGMDIICLTSDNEGTPVSLIEAQAGFLPVISTNVGGVKDILNENESGFVIEKGDIETYSGKLRLLVENKELRTKMGQIGHDFVIEKFNYTTLVSNMKSLYSKLLSDKNIQ